MREKRIAVPAKISTHTALLDKYLREGGLTLNDVRTKVISPPNMLKALQADYIDAFIVAEPFCSKAESMGIGKTLILSKNILPNHICCTVAVRNEALGGNPEGIREWVSSLQQNGKRIDEDKADNNVGNIAEIIARYTQHKTKDIIGGMTNPNDRIVYSDLHPRIADYQSVFNISRQAGILSDSDLNKFIDDRFSEKIS